MVRRIDVTGAGGVHLAAWEFTRSPEGGQESGGECAGAPGEGSEESAEPDSAPGVLLLHGLMGRASHWAPAARLLTGSHRVVALDQRGHGDSGKPAEGPFTREAHLADAVAVIERLGLAPVTLVGHAAGALTAWQLAAARPDLVRALIVCDMRAAAHGAASQREWADWFRSWPLPFASLAEARHWFGEADPWLERPSPARGEFFAEMMAEGAEGWRPVFSREQLLAARAAWAHDAHWDQLAQVTCPALVVRGPDGQLGRAEAQEMVRVLPRGRYAEVAEGGHLVHYERPAAWYAAIEPFLDAHCRDRDRAPEGDGVRASGPG
ncbi:alpha/beta hydrolase [Streptomyces amakusaensis]|uniref:Alpha/beta fold hydrolase n=1 Tax=Streptomyces amakusaensis TaxID=67271 RepID=A0ABW0ALF8_9ACTN